MKIIRYYSKLFTGVLNLDHALLLLELRRRRRFVPRLRCRVAERRRRAGAVGALAAAREDQEDLGDASALSKLNSWRLPKLIKIK